MTSPFQASTMTKRKKLGRLRPGVGMTLIELIVSCAILLLLASAALPIARYTVIRQREAELKRNLLAIRDAVD